jgi:hypothetical protein
MSGPPCGFRTSCRFADSFERGCNQQEINYEHDSRRSPYSAIPAVAAEPIDPIFTAIEAHKAAAVGAEAVQRRMGALEDELQAKGRLQTERRLEDERRRGEEIEAALDQAWGVEQAAPDTNPSVFQMPRAAGEMVSFAAFDIQKRVKALRDALDRPPATIIRIGGNECA